MGAPVAGIEGAAGATDSAEGIPTLVTEETSEEVTGVLALGAG